MTRHIDRYIEASGADAGTGKRFSKLVRLVAPVNGFRDEREAMTRIKHALYANGFEYAYSHFKAQDVLKSRKGNCLGIPLLIGCLMGEHRIEPEFRISVNPMDGAHQSETEFVEKVNADLRYDNPELAEKDEEYPFRIFTPLEHTQLVGRDFILETTSKLDDASGIPVESARRVNFNQALSNVYKDRAVEANSKGDFKGAVKLLGKGISLWPENRQVHFELAGNHHLMGNVGERDRALGRFYEIGGDDSLFDVCSYRASGDVRCLDRALAKNPNCADAIALKAGAIAEKDPREAKYLFALASHMYSNSPVLGLRAFYGENAQKLATLYGKDKVKKIMRTL